MALLMELRTSCATEPDPMLINAGIGAYEPASCTAKPLKARLVIDEL